MEGNGVENRWGWELVAENSMYEHNDDDDDDNNIENIDDELGDYWK